MIVSCWLLRRSQVAATLMFGLLASCGVDPSSLYDAHRDGMRDYADSMAMNTDHLSLAGARPLSRRLDSLIAALR